MSIRGGMKELDTGEVRSVTDGPNPCPGPGASPSPGDGVSVVVLGRRVGRRFGMDDEGWG